MKPSVTLSCDARAMIGESPVWRPATARLSWVDPVRRMLISAKHGHGPATELAIDASAYAIAAAANGALIAALEDGFALVDEASGAMRRLSSVTLEPGCRLNDMCVDPRGGVWVGAMHKGLLACRGGLYYAPTPEAPIRLVARGLGVPNGMGFDSIGTLLYVVDTLTRTLLAYPVDLAAGSAGEPCVVTDFMNVPGKPDGMTVAADGTLWVAMWGGSCVVQLSPDGALQQTIDLPAPHVSSVCFDADGRLWASTSRMRLSEAQLAQAPMSGAMFLIQFI